METPISIVTQLTTQLRPATSLQVRYTCNLGDTDLEPITSYLLRSMFLVCQTDMRKPDSIPMQNPMSILNNKVLLSLILMLAHIEALAEGTSNFCRPSCCTMHLSTCTEAETSFGKT